MNNKKSFRIKRSAKMDELVNQNQLLQKALQKIVGGQTNKIKGIYGRLAGIIAEENNL